MIKRIVSMSIFKILRDKGSANHLKFQKDRKCLQKNFKRKIFDNYAFCGDTVFAVPAFVGRISK